MLTSEKMQTLVIVNLLVLQVLLGGTVGRVLVLDNLVHVETERVREVLPLVLGVLEQELPGLLDLELVLQLSLLDVHRQVDREGA